jgi:hypothetical protein
MIHAEATAPELVVIVTLVPVPQFGRNQISDDNVRVELDAAALVACVKFVAPCLTLDIVAISPRAIQHTRRFPALGAVIVTV